MRIGVDGRELLGKPTGVGRYLAELLAQWASSPEARREFLVYTPGEVSELTIAGQPVAEISSFRHRAIPGGAGVRWEQLDLGHAIDRDGLDLFFAPAYSAPLRASAPLVVTMHDVSFMAHPEWFRWREGLRRRVLAGRTMSRARGIIAVSQFSHDEILRFFDLPSERVHVVRSGMRQAPLPHSASPQTPLVLFVGSIFNRRHVPTLLSAFGKVCRAVPDAQLVLVGEDRSYPSVDLPSLIAATGVGDRISLRSYVHESELTALYQRARVFAFLSEYEGFGFTPLEAMSAGVPAVVADTPVARELCGNAASFVPIRDIAATARAITQLLVDPVAHARQRALGASLVSSYSWRQAAQETLDVLEQAARHNG